MDDKIQEMFGKILDNQTGMAHQLKDLNTRFDGLETRLEDGLGELSTRVEGIEHGMTDLSTKVEGIEHGMADLSTRVEGMEHGLTDLSTRVEGMEHGLGELSTRVIGIETKLEHDIGNKIRSLYDAREPQRDTNELILNTLERIEGKIDVLQLETAHVRKVK